MRTVLRNDDLLVISLPSAPGAARAGVRLQLRQALCDAASAWLDLPCAALHIASVPGNAPQLLLDTGHAPVRQLHCSFSHEDGLSLAAVSRHGPVGVDLMRVAAFPDWQSVARDYLDPATYAALRDTPAAQQALAFAQAWTRHEARLKCAGRALAEWQPGAAPLPGHCADLHLPAPYVAALACNSGR